MKQLRLIGEPDLGIIPISDATVSVKLIGGIPIVIDVPVGATTALFSCGVEFFAAEGAAAALPVALPAEGAAERNPNFRTINAGVATIGLVSSTDGSITVSFYG